MIPSRRALFVASIAFCAMAVSIARAETDACTLLTSAQVGAAAGVAVGTGSHVTPTFVKTCTWTPSAKSAISAITLNMQTAATYDGGKQQVAVALAATKAQGVSMKPASVGDDAYYYVTGEQVGLLVKKGGVSFKVAVYAKMPVADKQAIELKLAKDVVAKL